MATPPFPDAGGDGDQYYSIDDDDEINDTILSLNSEEDNEFDFRGSARLFRFRTSEQTVINETSDVVSSFLYQRYQNDSDYFGEAKLESNLTCSNGVITDIGHQLAEWGDAFEDRHSKDMDILVRGLVVNSETAYPAFKGIASKLFEKGTTWARLVALLCFGYHLIRKVFRTQALEKAFDLVLGYIKLFICESVAGWIADQGGWSAVLLYWPASIWHNMSTSSRVATVATAGVVACALIAVLFHKLR